MGTIKILLSSRPKLLSEVIRNLIESQLDMEIIGEVIDPLQLLSVVRDTLADAVIITPLRANGEPRIVHQLLKEYPLMKIVTLSSQGDAAYLYRLNHPRLLLASPSGPPILNALRGEGIPRGN